MILKCEPASRAFNEEKALFREFCKVPLIALSLKKLSRTSQSLDMRLWPVLAETGGHLSILPSSTTKPGHVLFSLLYATRTVLCLQ